MQQWFLILGLSETGDRKVYKARLEDREQAERLAAQLGFDDGVTILDEARIARVGQYGYGFQLVFRIAPELDPAEFALDAAEGADEERRAA
ncbi:hypothetical protein [Arhodomonas sp. SL1]|uniref:hypothetical protein n=1 Tax=Arhodomonas sp. SL1 TaxID=3425691 RepID=UPI003F88056D